MNYGHGIRRWGWIVGAVVLFLPFFVRAESINDFSSRLDVDQQGVLSVQETIRYDFGTNDRHGIYRTIPISYSRDGFHYRIRLHVTGVQRAAGDGRFVNEPFTVSHSGSDLSIKIGDADRVVNGVQRYAIAYTVRRAINWFAGAPEIYWNVTGNAWTVPINNAEILLEVPELNKTNTQCFTGSVGSQEQNCTIGSLETASAEGGSTGPMIFAKALAPGEGLTIVTRLPVGAITRPGARQLITDFLRDNLGFGIPLLVLLGMIFLYRSFGKDPLGQGTIIAEYEPPEKLSPAMVGFLVDERVDPRDLTASIFNLAVKGYLTIAYEDKTFGHTYRLTKRRAAGPELTQFEKQLFDDLFLSGPLVSLNDLKRSLGKEIAVLRNKLQSDAQQQNFFVHRPQVVRNAFLATGVVLIFGGIQLISLTAAGIGLILSGIIVMAFSPAMVRRTEHGVRLTEQIQGFKLFLSVTDTERFKFHNAPAQRPQQFMTFLPYAIALGVEKEWAKQFQGVTLEQPDWYSGNYSAFNAMVFASSVRDFSTTAQTQAVAAAAGAGSGGSGFSGGFSGGGFGGGGGGSW